MGGTWVFLHLSDLQRNGVTIDMVPGVIAGLTDLSVISRCLHSASRFIVRPGANCAGPSLVTFPALAVWLWENIIVTKFEACPADSFCSALAFAREVCPVAHYRDLGVVAPGDAFDGVSELIAPRLIEGGTAELTSTLYAFEVLRFELINGASSTGNALKNLTDDVEAEHLENVQDVCSFFDKPGCVHRELSWRFASVNEIDSDCSTCGS